MTLSFLQSEAFYFVFASFGSWIKGPATAPAILSLSCESILEDLLSVTGVGLKLFLSHEEQGSDVNADRNENGDGTTIIGGFSFGPRWSPI